MTNPYALKLLSLLKPSDPELISALITAFSVPQPSVTAANWRSNKNFKGDVSAALVWEKYVDAEFKCCKCGSRLRLCLDHIDSDNTNVSPENLQVLCNTCNRSKSSKATKTKHLNAKVFRICVDHYEKTGTVPPASAVANYLKVQSLGGASTVYKWVKYLLETSVESVDNHTQED